MCLWPQVFTFKAVQPLNAIFLEEESIIHEVAAGDRRACHMLFMQYKDKVFNTALSLLQHREDAEDVTQEVFTEVFTSIGRFRGDARLSTWIYRIAVTRALDQLRKKGRKKRQAVTYTLSEGFVDPPDFEHPGVQLEHKEKAAILFRAIDQLPENQKSAFVLHKLEGLPQQEIALVLETTVSAVESLMHRAKENLRKYLAEYFKGE